MSCQAPLRALSTLLLVALCSTTLPAQMSGAYTIDPNGSGARNFTNFSNAAYQLAVLGVNGPVTITVADGTYTESWYLGPIPGASATNLVTFKSAKPLGAKLTHGSAYTILQIQDYTDRFPVQWIVLDGLEFLVPSPSGSRTAIAATGSCSDFEIRGCRFTNSSISANGLGRAKRWHIHHNIAEQVRLHDIEGFQIHHNEIRPNGYGLEISTSAGVQETTRVYNNVFIGATGGEEALLKLDAAVRVKVDHNTFVAVTGSCVRMGGAFARPCELHSNILISQSGAAVAQFYDRSSYFHKADGNVYWGPTAPYLFTGLKPRNTSAQWSIKTLGDWQKTSGLDTNSFSADPKLAQTSTQPFDVHVVAGSPAIGNAVNTPSWVTDDFFGTTRLSKPTIGGVEYIPPSTFTPYGSGCAGTGGKVPAIGMGGDLKLGSTNFLVTLANAKGGSGVSAFFALGATKANLNFGGGCTLLVTPQLLLQLPVSGLSGAGNGSASLRLAIPDNPKLRGAVVHCQWGVIDSAAMGIGIAFSNAATIRI